MIKFFKTFRQKMLSENKISKYLIYAIGEIILVVIGILIALSINNWNEKRKATFEETKLVRGLLADVKADSLFYTSRLELFTNQIEFYENLYALCSRTEQTSEDANILSGNKMGFRSAANHSDVVSNNTNIMDHITSDSIQNALRDYYKSFQFVSTAIELTNSKIYRYATDFREKYGKISKLNTPETLLYYKEYCELQNLEGILESLIFSHDNSHIQTIRFLKDNERLKQKLTQYLKELQ